MKNFFERLKNIGGVLKFIYFLSDLLSVVAQCYEKHFPQQIVEEKKEVVDFEKK